MSLALPKICATTETDAIFSELIELGFVFGPGSDWVKSFLRAQLFMSRVGFIHFPAYTI